MSKKANCVLLADRHQGLRDGVRGLLKRSSTPCSWSLPKHRCSKGRSASRLKSRSSTCRCPKATSPGLVARIRQRAPGTRVLLLSVHDERSVAEGAFAAGADAVVLKRCLITDLLPAVDAVLAGRRYLSPGIKP
jgi:DNA-binding NarL/FixJ family response regulator